MNTSSTPPTPDVWLLDAAKRHARFALRSRTANDQEADPLTVAVAAGCATEAILKAAVAKFLPGLLALNGDTHTQLYLSGKGGLPGKTYADCRTVSPADAHKILKLADPMSKATKEDIDRTMSVRNAAAHLGYVQDADLGSAVDGMVLTIESILLIFGTESKDFWGSELAQIASVINQGTLDQRLAAIHQALAAARLQYQRLGQVLGEGGLELIIESRDAEGYPEEDDGRQFKRPERCPACDNHGWLEGFIQLHPPEFDDDVSYRPRSEGATEFHCDVCGLYLFGWEVEDAGIEVDKELDPEMGPFIRIDDEWVRTN